ncbi:MAG TPA: methyltransferase domain-containing protein [Longimicrobium sp.]|nr:methyltransferase domain-containing protein [Longimicrobium sp.]
MPETQAQPQTEYVPAAGRHWLLPFYDLLTRLMGADRSRKVLVDQAACRPGDRVLDVGCGTGSLLIQLKQHQPAAEVTGLDPDPGALAIARRKAERAGVAMQLDQGFAGELPYADGTFHRVLSSLMYHHLRGPQKEQMLREVRRVLKPGGSFHMLDFAGPGGERRGFIASHLHSHRALRDNDQERVLAALHAAGFSDARATARLPSLAGSLLIYHASVPGSAS